LSKPIHLGKPLEESDRERVRRLVELHGERGAAVLLGIADRTVVRCLAGLGVQPGTRALVHLALDRVEKDAA
jgi:hypothetical protein